jgi:IS5 family transposase
MVMIALLILQYLYDLSDREVIAQYSENVVFQAFAGRSSYTQEAPCHPSSLARFRQRIGKEGCEIIFSESVRVHGEKALEPTCIVDTSVQEKAITFPTDPKLLLKVISLIKKIGKFMGLPFAKSYKNTIKTLKNTINFSKDKQTAGEKIAPVDRLRNIANSLLKSLMNQIPKGYLEMNAIKVLMARLEKVINQKKDDKNKIYSLHEPQVNCIAKGKADKKYEFGSKVSFIVTKITGIVVGSVNFKDNLYDGDTLEEAIDQLRLLHGGYEPETLVADRGYRGRPEVKNVKIVTPYDMKEGLPSSIMNRLKRLFRRRSSIEPIIGHVKHDHRLSKNLLKGELGDTINPLLAASAFNFLKLARIEYENLHRPPKSLAIRIRQKRMKFTNLPIWKKNNPLF